MSGRQKCSLEQNRRRTSPKPPPCCRKPPGRAERKMAGKPRTKLRPECARSIRGHRQFCNRGQKGAYMKSTARVYPPARTALFALALFTAFGIGEARAQNEPILVPEAVDYQKLLPILPEPLPGWTADKPEGSTEDVGGFKITNVHRDYRKGEGEKAPSAAISILDSVANPDYVSATTEAWKS